MTEVKSMVKSDQCLRLFSSRRQPPLLVMVASETKNIFSWLEFWHLFLMNKKKRREKRLSKWYILCFLSSLTLHLFTFSGTKLFCFLICLTLSFSLLLAFVYSRSLALSHGLSLSCSRSQSRSHSLWYNLFYAPAHVDSGSFLDGYAKSYYVFTCHGHEFHTSPLNPSPIILPLSPLIEVLALDSFFISAFGRGIEKKKEWMKWPKEPWNARINQQRG